MKIAISTVDFLGAVIGEGTIKLQPHIIKKIVNSYEKKLKTKKGLRWLLDGWGGIVNEKEPRRIKEMHRREMKEFTAIKKQLFTQCSRPTKPQSEWINLMHGDQSLKTLKFQQQKKQSKPCDTYKQSYNTKLKSVLGNQPKTTTGPIKRKMLEFKIKKPEESSLNWKPWHKDWDAITSNDDNTINDDDNAINDDDNAINDDGKYRYNRKRFLEDDESSDDSIFIVDPGWDDYSLQAIKSNRPVPLCPEARRARMEYAIVYSLEYAKMPKHMLYANGIFSSCVALALDASFAAENFKVLSESDLHHQIYPILFGVELLHLSKELLLLIPSFLLCILQQRLTVSKENQQGCYVSLYVFYVNFDFLIRVTSCFGQGSKSTISPLGGVLMHALISASIVDWVVENLPLAYALFFLNSWILIALFHLIFLPSYITHCFQNVISSMYTAMNDSVPLKHLSIFLWNTAGAFFRPNGMTSHS
ncbi:hypothetical protein Tco_0796493 [Tanacetum coccineum]